MSDSKQSTITELLEWFKQAPRTLGWDAIMAFDQASCNTVLRQQYIERFNQDAYLPPWSETVDQGNGAKVEFRDLRLDAPRLSFETADLLDARVSFTSYQIGGIRYNVDVAGVQPRVTQIAYLVPTGSEHYFAETRLGTTSGRVAGAQVVLNLGEDGVTLRPRLTAGTNGSATERVGRAMQQNLAAQPLTIKEFPLSTLKPGAGGADAFQPESLALRTQPAPNGTQIASVDYGKGAVLVFVKMAGGNEGNFPSNGSSNWRYLLDPANNGHDALVAFGQRWWLLHLLYPAASGNARWNNNELDYSSSTPSVQQHGEWDVLAVTGDTLPVKVAGSWGGGYQTAFEMSGNLSLRRANGEASYVSIVEDGKVKTTWEATGWLLGSLQEGESGISIGEDVDLLLTLEVALRSEDGEATVEVTGSVVNRLPIKGDRLRTLFPNPFLDFRQAFKGRLAELGRTLDAARLASLLIGGNQPITLDGLAVPGDMVMWGKLNPSQLTLAIAPMEVTLGTGATQAFSIATAATWSLEVVDGAATDIGSIDGNGRYTAPASLAGQYARIRVKAQADDDAVSYALVTVTRSTVSVTPAVQLAMAGSSRAFFVRGGGTVDYTWDTSGLKGSLALAVPGPGDDPAEFDEHYYQYTPPPPTAFTGQDRYLVDKIVTKASTGSATASSYVLAHRYVENITIKVELAANGASATLTPINGKGNEMTGVTWAVVAGSGTLNGAVLSTPSTIGDPFVVVEAFKEGEDDDYRGYALLPMPLALLEGSAVGAVLARPRTHEQARALFSGNDSGGLLSSSVEAFASLAG